MAAAKTSITQLPPGSYVARAVIAIGLDEVGRVSRAFTIPAKK